MDLIYLWVENYKNIKRQGFEIDSRFNFSLTSPTIESRDFELSIDMDDSYVNLFHNNIIEVTGIIGKNGSGKSNFLDCLKMLYGQLHKITSPLIFAVLDAESKQIYTYYYKGGGVSGAIPLSLKVKGSANLKKSYSIKAPKGYQIKRLIGDGKVVSLDFEFTNTACCFFTNGFDDSKEQIFSSVLNLSTNTKLHTFLNTYIERKIQEGSKQKSEVTSADLFPSHMTEFHDRERRNLLRFISYASRRKSGKLPDIPKALQIEFNFEDFIHLLNMTSLTSRMVSKSAITTIQEQAVQQVRKSKDKKVNFLNLVVLCSFYFSLRWDIFKSNGFKMDRVIRVIDDIAKDPSGLFDKLREFLEPLQIVDDNDSKTQSLKEILGSNFSEALKKIVFIEEESKKDLSHIFQVTANNDLWDVLSIINQLKHTVENSFLNYHWHGISAGEEAYFSRFARLFEVKGQIGRRPILLLIDEGDLYFHPQWQKEYLDQLLLYIEFLFPQNKVKIILTTHSPFIVSDLPKQRLIFLEKDKDGQCEVVNTKLKKETFGSNIHELFTDSFFLENGLMGEFARKKIESLINEIKARKVITRAQFNETYKNRVNIIGESFLRSKIVDLIASKSPLDLVDQLIVERTNELDILNEIRAQRQNDQD